MLSFLTRVWHLAKPYRARLFIGVFTGIVAGLFEPLMVAVIAFVYGVVFPSPGASPLEERLSWVPEAIRDWVRDLPDTIGRGLKDHPSAVILLLAAIPAVILGRGVFAYLNVYFLQWTAIRVVIDLRVRLFTHLMNLSTGFFSANRSGELISRIMSDTGTLQVILSSTTSTIVKDPVTLVGLFAYLMWQQPKLTLVSMIVLPICVVPITIYSRRVRRSARALQMHTAELTQVMNEAFTGNRIVKAYNLEHRVVGQFREAAGKFMGHFMRIVRSNETPGPLIEFMGAVGVALVFLYLLAGTQQRVSADFLAVILAIYSMYRPIKSLTRLHSQVVQARAATERVFELLENRSEVREPIHPKTLKAAGEEITFDQIDFTYDDKPVLRGVNLRIQPGQLVALVGASGSGKTTLANLLLRFYDPQRGAVRIGGLDLREVATRDLRNQVAVVTQETILFNDTVRRNIELGRPGASEKEIIAAARHAHAHEFIAEKPEGYDTTVGEKGVLLSGGQRQRLAIARAVLKDAPILILDEATSALDTESERAVQEALDELMQGRTTICIAHRLSTIQRADLIVVLDQGRIVEQGKHDQLLQHGGVYRKLYELQFNV